MNGTTPKRYTGTAISLHWLIALLIFVGFGVGQIMSGLSLSPLKLQLVNWHKWIGVSVFLLAAIRVAWRVTHQPPAEPPMPGWQAFAAKAAHVLLYILMFGIPLSGWLMSSANGYQTVYFGLIPLPDLLDKNEALVGPLKLLHVAQCNVLLAVVVMHIAGAFKHQLMDKDGLIGRMTPSLGGAGPMLFAGLGTLLFVATLVVSFGGEEHEEGDAPVATLETAVPPGAADDDLSLPSLDAPTAGTLNAAFTQMGVTVDAEFKRFAVDIQFDAHDLANSQVAVNVDVNSFDIGDEMYNDSILDSEWLDGATYPHASFMSTSIVDDGQGGFIAKGPFTLKGVTVEEEIPFSVTPLESGAQYAGRFDISRGAHHIGGASWDGDVEDAVVISFVVTP